MPEELEPVFGGSAPSSQGEPSGTAPDSLGNSANGNPNPQEGFAGGQGTDNQPNSFLSALSEENRQIAASKKWSDPNDVIQGYRAAETRLSQGLQIKPEGEDGQFTPEQWDQFGKKVGAPEKPEFYQFDRPDTPDYVAYDQGLEDKYRETAHKYKLNKAQAAGFYKEMAEHMVNQQMTGFEDVTVQKREAHQQIADEYGGVGSPMYKDMTAQAFHNIKSTPGLLEAYQRAGFLVPAGEGRYDVTNSAIVFHHAKVGSALNTESNGLNAMNGQSSQTNPFAESTQDWTAQGKIIRENPQLASSLIRQAGMNPADYNLKV